jgi:hypothetical protein
MRKHILASLLLSFLLLFTNCSDSERSVDSEVNSEDSSFFMRNADDFQKLKQDYMNILKSSDYNIYKESVSLFYSKLNVEEELYFEDETKLLNWIDLNIAKTEFSNANEAISYFNDIKSNYNNVLTKNSIFYDNIKVLDESQQIELFLIGIGDNPFIEDEYETNAGPCENECVNDGVACGRAADNAYAAAMSVSAGFWATGNAVAAIGIAAVASINHTAAQHSCARGVNTCMRGCGW